MITWNYDSSIWNTYYWWHSTKYNYNHFIGYFVCLLVSFSAILLMCLFTVSIHLYKWKITHFKSPVKFMNIVQPIIIIIHFIWYFIAFQSSLLCVSNCDIFSEIIYIAFCYSFVLILNKRIGQFWFYMQWYGAKAINWKPCWPDSNFESCKWNE